MPSALRFCVYSVLFSICCPANAVELRQVVSREHPAIRGTGEGLAVGRDGSIYVSGIYEQGGYVLRVSRDGTEKFGVTTNYAITGVAARQDGILATSNAHFAKSISVYDREGRELGKVGGFTGNDQVGWDGPGTLEVGSSGDFYALDQHAGRIVRINAAAEIVRSYPLPAAKEFAPHKLWTYGFRLHEPAEQFYFVIGPEIQCWGFDGMKRWSVPARVAGDPWGGFAGGFDADDVGRLYLNDSVDPTIRILDKDGQSAGELRLDMGDRMAGPLQKISHLRVFGDDIIVRQKSETEIFQVYDRTTGGFRRAVSIDYEQLTVTYPEPIWTAGKTVPLSVRFEASGRPVQPRLTAWLRPLGSVEFIPLPIQADGVQVPAEVSGLHHLRVGSGLNGDRSEYQVESIIEIRPENAVGSVSIFTPLNRRSFSLGEAIPVAIRFRTKDPTALPETIELQLVNDAGKVHFRDNVTPPKSAEETVSLRISEQVTSKLPPGKYRVTTSLPHWTVAEQHLWIGPGRKSAETAPFYRVRHGDYTAAFPTTTYFNSPEQVGRHLNITQKLGENLIVDRLGHPGSGVLGELPNTLRDVDLIARLQADPIAVAAEKAEFENRILQTVAGYGAAGIEQRSILLFMDAGLPVGTGFDRRSAEEFARDIHLVTKRLSDYPAFRGWSWAANWWIEKRGGEMALTPAEKTAYEAAYKTAQETGRWEPILETVSDRWFNHAVSAERQFRTAVESASLRPLISAMTGPYRQPGIHPPLTYAHADEVDLHFQAEQIQWPMISAHNVDFYKRPGKPAWGHPEVWNDDGTGGQILSTALQMVMRGANGIGQSGSVKGFAPLDSDPRSMGAGATSIHRQLNTWLAAYGPWLSHLESSDPVAIPVSTRMMRLELGWQGVGGFYFTRLFEAYNACLRAHRPASFVFSEDCRPDSLAKFQAVLLVSQTVELDPPLQAALHSAMKSNIPIYADRSCRPEVLQDVSLILLERDFTRLEKEHHLLNDDSAFWRYREIVLEHAADLVDAWETAVPPVARCDQPEVLLTERRWGDSRVLWAVNDAAVPLEPGQLWRVSLAVGSRLPVRTTIDWPSARGCDVYELFSGETIDAEQRIPVDLCHAPARVFVALPKADRPGPITKHLPVLEPIPPAEPFGARIRELVVSHDQRSALVTAAGWDRNAMLVDVETGTIMRQPKIGHHFTYAPTATSQGFAVQGYDFNTAEGYHLYLLNSSNLKDELVQRRFALYGLPKRGVNWAIARQWQDSINNFAISPDGSWIATAGDLGLVVWSKDGQKLWSLDWWPTDRQRRRLFAADSTTLIAYDGCKVTSHRAADGEQLWSHLLGETGILTGAAASADGTIVALRSTANGGRIFVLHNGRHANTLATPADEFVLSHDGKYAAVTWRDELRLFDTDGGLLWSVVADDILRHPRFRGDGQRLSVGTELGTLLIFDVDGRQWLHRDLGALPVTTWLKDGGLIVGTWLGRLSRWNAEYEPMWTAIVRSNAEPSRFDLLAKDETPTVQMDGWGNAAPESAPLTPNLLAETQALIEARCEPTTHGDPRTWQNNIELLRDGDPAISGKPWLEWTDVSYLDSGWRQKLVVQVDTFRSQIRLEGITLVEDAAHPESWVRDARVQWWDTAAETWCNGPYILFNGKTADAGSKSVTHTHWFETPMEAAKFRLVSTSGASWPVGNLRWGELVFHGQVLGPSHPDAVANRPVAVLFDEQEDVLKNLLSYGDYPFSFRYDEAYSGGKSLALTRAGSTTPNWRPPFGHVLPNWDFEIVEQPEKSGQYRWLEFAWKAAAPETTGVTLRLGPHHGGGVALHAGEATNFESVVAVELSPTPPAEWKLVRVDLWKLHGKSFEIRSLSLGAVGGGALFDRIRLGRTEQDLEE